MAKLKKAAGLAAIAAAIYLMSGDRGKKNKKAIQDLLKKGRGIKDVTTMEAGEIVDEIKQHWERMTKEVAEEVGAKKKKKTSVKKMTKKTSKKK